MYFAGIHTITHMLTIAKPLYDLDDEFKLYIYPDPVWRKDNFLLLQKQEDGTYFPIIGPRRGHELIRYPIFDTQKEVRAHHKKILDKRLSKTERLNNYVKKYNQTHERKMMEQIGNRNSEETYMGTFQDGSQIYVQLSEFVSAPIEERYDPYYWLEQFQAGNFDENGIWMEGVNQ